MAIFLSVMILTFLEFGSLFAPLSAKAIIESDEGTETESDAVDEFHFDIEEHLDPATQGRRVRLEDDEPASLLEPVLHRSRRQVVIETPTEDVRCLVQWRNCQKRQGVCVNITDADVCKGTGSYLDFHSEVCKKRDRSSLVPTPCEIERCWDEVHRGRCISLRGGMKACKSLQDPPILLPEARECL